MEDLIKHLFALLGQREFNKNFHPSRPVVVARVSFGYVQVIKACDSYINKDGLQFVNLESEKTYTVFEN